MYADMGFQQTAMNVVLQVLLHPAPETSVLIRELLARVRLPALRVGGLFTP